MADTPMPELDDTLAKLRLNTFVHNHAAFANDALHGHHTHQKYLLDLATRELDQRDRNRHIQRFRVARIGRLRHVARRGHLPSSLPRTFVLRSLFRRFKWCSRRPAATSVENLRKLD